MNKTVEKDIEAWESENGASPASLGVSAISSGTMNQVEWAERIKRQVNDEFDRVETAAGTTPSGRSRRRFRNS